MTKLTHDERSRLLASVQKMIHRSVFDSRLPRREREDATSYCNLVLWQATEAFDPSGSARFSTWAGKVLHNAVRRYEAKLYRECGGFGSDHDERGQSQHIEELVDPRSLRDLDADDEDEIDQPVGQLAVAARRQMFGPALDSLPPGLRAIVEGIVFDGLSIQDFAVQTGQEPRTVKTNLTAALARLAAEGHIPADLAERFGFDTAVLAERADYKLVKARATERQSKVSGLLADGKTDREIAKELGINACAVRADVGRIERRAAKAQQTAERRQRVGELSARGLKTREIAAALGVPVHAVSDDRAYLRKQSLTSGCQV